MRHRAGLAVTLLGLAAGAVGCVGKALESGHETPIVVRLAAPQVEAGTAQLPLALTVARTRAASSLDTDRIVVRQPQLGFDYYLGVRWSEPAPEMLQRLLVETLAAGGRWAAVYAAPARVPAEQMLDVELRRFEADYANPDAAPTVRIEAQFTLVGLGAGGRLASFALVETEPAQQNRRDSVLAAFDRATARLLQQAGTRLGAVEPPPARAPGVASGGQQ
jgi:cholesterol transport system auxiliary component